MFRLPAAYVRQMILEGRKDRPINDNNEIAKGYNFEDQARVNLRLEKSHEPQCIALEDRCRKDGCAHFTTKTGKLEGGWACREYQVDFPEAQFDSRYHVAILGVDKPDIEATIENVDRLVDQGAKSFCMYCFTPYQRLPGHAYNGGWLEICPCGSDLFMSPEQFKEMLEGWKKG